MPRPKVLTLLLAGGEGGRLGVLTEQRAKPVIPFAGTYRLIDFALSNCLHSGLSDVWVIEQYEPHALNEHLANGRPWDLDRTRGGLQVLPPFTSKNENNDGSGFAQGNADALYRNRAFIRAFAPDLLLVLSADHVYKLDYRDVIDQHQAGRADVTMVVTEVEPKEAGRFGVVRIGDHQQVTDFAYKPDTPGGNLVTTEVFVYDARVLLETLDQLAAEKAGNAKGDEENANLKDFGHELLPHLVQKGRAFAYALDGYWRDVGTIPSYHASHQDLLLPDTPFLLDDPRWPIITRGTQRAPARVYQTARIDNSLIAPGCTVGGEVVRSVLAPGVVVEEGAVVRDSILLHSTVVQRGAVVSRAIVDEQVHVGKEVLVGADSDITVIGRRAHIADRARVAAGAQVKPDATAQDD